MKRKLLILVTLLFSVCTLSFGATLSSMDKKAVMAALQDKTITTMPLATLNNKLIMNRISIYFGSDGKAAGQFARKPEDNPRSDMGTWTVKGDGLLCVNWQHWTSGKEMCAYTYDLKNSLVFASQSGYFDSMVLHQHIQTGDHVAEIKSPREMMKQMKMKHKEMMAKEQKE